MTMSFVTVQAQPLGSPAGAAKRQLIGCMTKQMTASKTISYNEAAKLCKELTKTAAEAPGGTDGHPGNNH